MKKNKDASTKNRSPLSPEEAIQFLDDIRVMMSEVDEPTVPISLRLPANILRAVKLKAKSEGKKYQSVIVEYIRKGVRS